MAEGYKGRSPEECSLFAAARAMGKCIWQESCERECQFNMKVVHPTGSLVAGFKVPARAWRRSWVPGFWRTGSWVPGFWRRLCKEGA